MPSRPALLVAALAAAGCAATGASPRSPGEPPPASSPAREAGAAGDTPAEAAVRAHLAASRAATAHELAAEVEKIKLPSLAFGLVYKGRLVYWIGLGARDAAGGAVTDETVYRIGSVTKAITGMAILKLRDEGKLGLDDPVERFFPDFASLVYPSKDSPRITVRHLVTHTSGLPRLGTLAYGDGREVSFADLLRAVRGQRVDFAPGSQARYSNLAMALAGVVVARASGERYRDYVSRHLLAPLGMTSTVWDREAVPADRLAQGYEHGKDGHSPCGPHWRLGAAEAMGGLYSSVADMARFVAFQLAAWPPRDEPDQGPLRRSSVRESQLVAGHARAGREGFGINWVIKDEPRLGYTVFHNGGTEGYSASVWMLPDRGIGVVALSPSAEELDAITKRALTAIVKGLPKDLGAPARAALDRVKRLVDAPDPAGIDAAFAPEFLASIPRDKLLALFRDLHERLGRCAAEEVVSAKEPEAAEVDLACERGGLNVKLHAQPGAPHRITYLLVKPR